MRFERVKLRGGIITLKTQEKPANLKSNIFFAKKFASIKNLLYLCGEIWNTA